MDARAHSATRLVNAFVWFEGDSADRQVDAVNHHEDGDAGNETGPGRPGKAESDRRALGQQDRRDVIRD